MSTDIIAAIDGALEDWQTSGDAMRWVPEGERLDPPTPPRVMWGVPVSEAAANITRAFALISFDASAFTAAMRRVAQAADEAASRLGVLSDPRWRARRRVGGAGNPRSDDWQSGPCSGWLHDACPNPTATDCRCTCHGGHLR